MKVNIKYTFLFCFLAPILFAQTKQFNLSKSNSQLFSGHLYSFGINSQKQNATCIIYKLDQQLKTLDSLTIDLGKIAPDNFLQLFSDTLHGFLNVYVQRKDKKLITILRLNKLFERVATIENVDVARLNSISNFESELFYYKNSVYTIKNQTDTGGKQFYLNKYELKSEVQNFEYEPKWQFPFERKNINSAHIFYADKNAVMLYVNVTGGLKFGQWILKVNANTGKLIRGTKLNDKGETTSYQYGTYLVDTAKRTTTVIGQRFTTAQLDQKGNKLAISNAQVVSIYIIDIDSAGEVLSKQDLKIPVNEPKTTSKKIISNYILRMDKLSKSPIGALSFEGDIYKNTDNTLCYLYANTILYQLTPEDESLVLEKNFLGTNQMIEKYYFNTDKMDMNGKICIDSLSQFETFFYKSLNFPIKKQFKIVDNNPVWLLTRSDIKKNSINYTVLGLVNKIYQLTALDEILKSKSPSIITLTETQFVLSSQEEEGKFQLKLISW
ncbi:MAG: hypothetical protein Q8L81_15300 [Bacteroidota bacterium]|nr:hypothetical protein [Bacteroidota bacterium]